MRVLTATIFGTYMDHKALTALGAQLVAGRYILGGKVVATHTNGDVALTEDGKTLKPKPVKTPAKAAPAEPKPTEPVKAE